MDTAAAIVEQVRELHKPQEPQERRDATVAIAAFRTIRELHKLQERRYIRSIAHECHGCDQGPHPEGPADWPCSTAEIVYTPDEITAVRDYELTQDHRG